MEAQVPYSGYSLASGPSLLSPPRPLHYIHTWHLLHCPSYLPCPQKFSHSRPCPSWYYRGCWLSLLPQWHAQVDTCHRVTHHSMMRGTQGESDTYAYLISSPHSYTHPHIVLDILCPSVNQVYPDSSCHLLPTHRWCTAPGGDCEKIPSDLNQIPRFFRRFQHPSLKHGISTHKDTHECVHSEWIHIFSHTLSFTLSHLYTRTT